MRGTNVCQATVCRIIPSLVAPLCLLVPRLIEAYPDIFLPSYADYESSELERRQDPVQDIILTDEEVASMFPSSS